MEAPAPTEGSVPGWRSHPLEGSPNAGGPGPLATILAADPRILWAHGGADRSLVRRQFRRHNRLFRVDVGKGGIHLRAIELPLPDRNDNGRHAIADDVGQRSDLAHELVDSKNDRKPWDEPRVGGGEGSTRVTKPAPVTPLAP